MSALLAQSNPVQVTGGIILWLLAAAACIGLWLLPVFIAVRRHSPNVNQVMVVDLLLSWTGIGWIVALVMALKPLPPPYPPTYAQYPPQQYGPPR